ncbi:VanZ family protein [Dorea acetigenes]|uniref:VanZ family protein n=1 Tax=Dorea acetigenes TaxID=2981787 RepID=A0ABT2RPH7_9FIRM|nr:VanZ family protein [Dorea acetigenes]MCU6687275.1 VanZ family protein [Dorea acetigenes]SCJ34326.1 Predicted integral membrane protein [uncultured Clostridium sp.]
MKGIWIDVCMEFYSLLAVFIPCMIYQFYAVKNRVNPKRKVSKKHLVWTYIFILYLYMALSVAGMGSIWDVTYYDPVIRAEEINLIPFAAEGAITYILNVIMFMPLGFLLPFIWKGYRSLWKVAAAGFLFSLAIELGQLFNRRCSDINDLLMNVLGAIVGYGIWLGFMKIFKKKKVVDFSLRPWEVMMYMVCAVLGRFFLYNWRWFVH